MEKFTPLAKNFTLPPAVTALTNITSDCDDNDQNYGFKVSLARRSLVRSGDNLMLSDFQMGSNTDFDFSHIGKGFFFSLHLFRVMGSVRSEILIIIGIIHNFLGILSCTIV